MSQALNGKKTLNSFFDNFANTLVHNCKMTKELEFNSSDIKWIKSVTRDKGKSWAYLDVKLGDTFPLNFSKNPKWYPTNYLKPKPGEVIALFQTLEATQDYKGGWYVTHLVSPIDQHIDKEDSGTHPYTRLVTVVGINAKPILIDSEEWSFYKCNRGQICNIKTIEKRGGADLPIEQKQKFVWDRFDKLDPKLLAHIPDLHQNNLDVDEYVAMEGRERTILRLHKFRERDPKAIKQAKEKAKIEKRFFCEVCLFDFKKQYPGLGDDFIECHHKQPISKGGIRKTKAGDLAIVCANCHRMLHRKYISGEYLTIDELRQIISKMMS